MTDTSTRPPGAPTWLRRTIIGVIVVAACGAFVWGTSAVQTGDGGEPLDGVIVSLSPPDDAQVPRQTAIGAELQPGYDGRLTINGIDIPEDEMDGAIDPNSVTPEQLAKYGIRPNNRNRVFFTPGPGKVIEEFDTGHVSVALEYFKDKQESTARTVTWTFRVD